MAAAAAAADEIILGDTAHLRPWILTRLHYNSITFFLIKMGKVTHERLSSAVWPLAVDTVQYAGLRHRCGHTFTDSKTFFIDYGKLNKRPNDTENKWMNFRIVTGSSGFKACIWWILVLAIRLLVLNGSSLRNDERVWIRGSSCVFELMIQRLPCSLTFSLRSLYLWQHRQLCLMRPITGNIHQLHTHTHTGLHCHQRSFTMLQCGVSQWSSQLAECVLTACGRKGNNYTYPQCVI